ncbi:uncharacterized protein LOC112203954 [Rosa chinensis]|uniref:uncharacterized protein LOC112203954 n=1 Tax=Rosa chinensis TaxID=74649 RepID=UPI000D08D316|nr:uncharacterized protein LOC112203954 [Rosa chinensis]
MISDPEPQFSKAITTRSGRTLVDPPEKGNKAQAVIEEEEDVEYSKRVLEKDLATSKVETQASPTSEPPKGNVPNFQSSVIANPSSYIPFPNRFAKSKKEEEEKPILEIFKKVQVNIPLIECLTQIPKYAKYLKELCTTRRRTREKKVVKMSENVLAVIQRKLPPKLKDPGSFSIPCTIGNTNFENVMLDLRASINVMPYSIYESLDLGELKNDNVIIQLADRSNAYLKGYVEDVLV